VVAVSEKILAIWGAERRGPGAKKSSFSGRTYWVRFAAVNALQRLQSIDRRLILRHLDFFSPKSFSLRGTRIFFAGVQKYHYPPVSRR
jgi:hypothetical protein